MNEQKIFDLKITEKFRGLIKEALYNIGLIEHTHYKLSIARNDRASFKMETLEKSISVQRIRKALAAHKFNYAPGVKNTGAFMEINLTAEYDRYEVETLRHAS